MAKVFRASLSVQTMFVLAVTTPGAPNRQSRRGMQSGVTPAPGDAKVISIDQVEVCRPFLPGAVERLPVMSGFLIRLTFPPKFSLEYKQASVPAKVGTTRGSVWETR